MEQGYLIDTNTIIDAQAGKLPKSGADFLADIVNEQFLISFVTYIEVLGYTSVSQTTQDFMALADVIEINTTIIDACITLRKQQKIKLPDAIIAATALVHGPVIISRNTKDFELIAGLTCINPHEL